MGSKYRSNQLILRYPTTWWSNMWREALPSGNGKIGAAVYGGVYRETILLNHHALWHGGYKDSLPDVSDTLEICRNLMKKKQYHEANWVLANQLREYGYKTQMAKPLPLGNLNLEMKIESGFTNYRRILDMETGEVKVSWRQNGKPYSRKLFVSRSDDFIVYRIVGDGLNCSLDLSVHKQDNKHQRYYEDQTTVKLDSQSLYYGVKHQDGTDFGAVLQIKKTDGKVIAANKKLEITDATEILILVKVFIGEKMTEAWSLLGDQLRQETRTYEELLEAHIQKHGELFNAVKIDINPDTNSANEELLLAAYDGEPSRELMQKMWAYGRYLFISGTSPNSYPIHMYGLWTGSYSAVWSHYMANENIQMMYWHALSGGLTEFIPAMYQYYAGHLEDFRENARKLFGCRGIFIPAGTTPLTGLPSQVVPVILNWTGAAGWLAQHFYQYYLFTGDAKFLVEKALPFMAEAALFYEDFLEEQKDGRLQIYPSVSPENSPKNYITPEAAALGHPMPSTINATMDIAIIKELLTNLLHASEATDLYGDKREIWQSMLEKLPAYEQNSDGAIKEWLNPDFEDNYNHRHLSHLYPVFPGQEVSREENGDLFDGFVTAVKKRLVVGISDQSGWSLAHMANIYARLEDGESALECLELLSRSCLTNNFYTLHNDWRNMGITLTMKAAPIQLDANLGWTAAVQEMLLFVSPRLVRVLPACPKKWIKGSVTGMRFTTGKISFTWDRTLHTLSAVLVADRATDIILKLPDGYGEYDFVCNEGVVSKLEEPNFWRIEMQAQSQLKIVSQPNK